MTDSNQLTTIIKNRIQDAGRITFAAFMEACLYEPGYGYYTSPGRKVGAAGDFYTSISVHAAFGRVLAREIAQMWRTCGQPDTFTLVECGAGNGRLACDILDYLAEREPSLYAKLALVLVEREPSLASAQREMLAAHGTIITWMTPEEFSSGALKIRGCIYSNELLDSLPVHRVLMTEQGLQELYVTLKDGVFAEETGELSTDALTSYLERIGITLHPGQIAEINLAAPAWLENAAQALEQGFILTIDYGFPAQELYAPHRKQGTLLCYYRHQVEHDPYLRLGEQDITSHVDFTTLMKQGEELQLHPVWFGEQYRFLLAAGIIEEIQEFEQSSASDEAKLKLRLTLKKLIMPDGGMGDTFRLLVQAKGVPAPTLLCQRQIGA